MQLDVVTGEGGAWMAKRHTKGLPDRQANRLNDADSLLLRSAESLGRVIGTLQRQVQGGTKRISSMADDAIGALPELPRRKPPATRTRKATKARKATNAARKTTGARKRTAAARKTTSRKR
jgi:hypothetical protein